EPRLPSGDLRGRFGARVAQRRDFGTAVELVVVDHDLGVEGGDRPVARGDEGIDLRQRCAHGVKGRIQPLHDVRRGARLRDVAVDLQREAQRLMREQAVARVYREPVDLLRRPGGTGMPCRRKMSRAWYSWRFTLSPS